MPAQFYGFSQTLSANMRNTLTELLYYKPNSAQAFLTVLFSLLATCTTSGGPAEEAVLKYGEGLIRICRTGVSLTSPELSHRAQPLPSAANRRAHPTNTGNTFISFLSLKAYLLVHTSSIDLQMPALSCECLMVRGFGGEYPSLYPSSSISFPLSPALFPFPPSHCGSFISDFIFWGFKSRFYTVNDRVFLTEKKIKVII